MTVLTDDTETITLCQTCALVWGAGYEPYHLGLDNDGEDWDDYITRTEPTAERLRHLTVEDMEPTAHDYVDCFICGDAVMETVTGSAQILP